MQLVLRCLKHFLRFLQEFLHGFFHGFLYVLGTLWIPQVFKKLLLRIPGISDGTLDNPTVIPTAIYPEIPTMLYPETFQGTPLVISIRISSGIVAGIIRGNFPGILPEAPPVIA